MNISIQSPKDPLLPPATNRLWISDNWNNSLGEAPRFAYKLQNVVVSDNETESVIDLKYENVSMTKDQWVKWSPDADDESYILECICENLGLSPA